MERCRSGLTGWFRKPCTLKGVRGFKSLPLRQKTNMRIYLVRHGEYSNPDNIFPFHLPVTLSEEGREHIKRVGSWFQRKDVRKIPIYTSPILRTRETAEIIASFTNSSIENDDRLIESYSPNLQGKRQPGKEGDNAAWQMQCSDQSRESSESVQKRMIECFNEKAREGKDCVLVSHGDPLTALYYHLIQKALVSCLFDDEHIDIYIKRGEIVSVQIDGDDYQTERITV